MSLRYESDEPSGEVVDEGHHRFTPPVPVYSIILISAYAAVTLVQLATGLDRSILIAGFDKHAFIAQHEYWRILTGAALHGGLLHVAMNSYAFYSFGRIMEMLSNRAHLAIVFLLSAIGGGVLSLLLMPGGVSVGASGGIVGIIGYLVVYAFKRREFISPEFRKNLLINIGFILIYGFVLYQVVDNYGHIGGLTTGAAYAFVQVPTDPYVDPRQATGTTETLGLVSLGIYIATCAFAILLLLRFI